MDHLYGEELSAGALAGGYVVERVAARGGSSVLYRAREAGRYTLAALKVLRSEYTFSPSALRRFHQEAALLRRVRHPHVVELYEAGELEDGRPYLAMEWVEGSTLAEWLTARGYLEAGEALPLVEQLCGALEAVHAAGLVHRDLKAQNVLVQERPGGVRLVLVDFGIARVQEPGHGSPLTSAGRVLGTPTALAPEQIRGARVDARADLYALGVLLHQVLSGQLPFRAATAVELMELHLHASPPRLRRQPPVPSGVEQLVLRCLEKGAQARPSSAGEVLAAFRRALEAPGAVPKPSRAAALYLELTAPEDAEGAVLERLDALWEQARQALQQAGLTLRAEGTGLLLAVMPLPVEPQAERQERARLLNRALELLQALHTERRGVDLAISLSLHAAEAEDELLQPTRWAQPGTGLVATPAALEGLEPATP